jgi:hypothetical protein
MDMEKPVNRFLDGQKERQVRQSEKFVTQKVGLFMNK